MTNEQKTSSPLLIFYFLVSYIILQLVWWAYLIYSLSKDVYLDSEVFQKKMMMIVGEGGVFFTLLVIGIIKFRKAINKEIALAQQKNNFLLSVTHELKSPLTSIKLYLQTLQKRDLEEEQKNKAIDKAISDTNRLSLLVDNIILATKIEDNSFPIHKEKINISSYIKEIIENINLIKGENHKTEFNLEPGIHVHTDMLAIYSIISNIYENALKYSPEETIVTISLSKSNGKILIQISDEGIGISEQNRNTIFKKFYREGNENTRKTKGTGLGLYIVKQLVILLKGEITVKKNEPTGTIFEMKFAIQ